METDMFILASLCVFLFLFVVCLWDNYHDQPCQYQMFPFGVRSSLVLMKRPTKHFHTLVEGHGLDVHGEYNPLGCPNKDDWVRDSRILV